MEGIGLGGSSVIGTLSREEEAIRPGGRQEQLTEERLKKACADFESIFITYMLKAMRRTIPKSGLNEFPGKEIYTMLLDQKVAEDAAQREGGMGIQKVLLRQLGRAHRPEDIESK